MRAASRDKNGVLYIRHLRAFWVSGEKDVRCSSCESTGLGSQLGTSILCSPYSFSYFVESDIVPPSIIFHVCKLNMEV